MISLANTDETSRIMEFFLHKQCELGRMKYTPYSDENVVWEAVNKVFKEWKWYRSQDLIKRSDVNFDCNKCSECDLTKECKFTYLVSEIPKAEPPKGEYTMTVDEAIKTIENEKRCVNQAENCNRDCAKCKLLMDSDEILQAFSIAIEALEELKKN